MPATIGGPSANIASTARWGRKPLFELNERYRVNYFTLNEDVARQIGPVIDELSR